eukprot:bmy_00737T0
MKRARPEREIFKESGKGESDIGEENGGALEARAREPRVKNFQKESVDVGRRWGRHGKVMVRDMAMEEVAFKPGYRVGYRKGRSWEAHLTPGGHSWRRGVDVSGGGVAHRVPSLAPGQRSPSPDLLDGRHHLLDVILGPAPGLGPHGPAGHAGGAGAEASPRLGRLPSGWLRLGARPGRRSLGLSSLRELAAPSLAPQGFRESPPRFLPPRPAPARPRSGRAARAARAQAWKPADPAPTGPAPSGHRDEQRPLPAAERQVGGSWATGRARWGCGRAFRPRGRQGAREGGRGGNRDLPGASMSRREGSLGKGLKGRIPSAEGSRGQKGWKLGSGPLPPLGPGRERPERGRAGPRCQVTSG